MHGVGFVSFVYGYCVLQYDTLCANVRYVGKRSSWVCMLPTADLHVQLSILRILGIPGQLVDNFDVLRVVLGVVVFMDCREQVR
jgi:hypothetical protein